MIKPNISRLASGTRIMQSTLMPMWKKVMEFFRNAFKKALEFLRKTITILTKKPSQKEDYVKIGRLFFSKRFLLLGSVFLIIGIVLMVKVVYPWADGRLWTATVKVNTSKYQTFTGKAKVKDKTGRAHV